MNMKKILLALGIGAGVGAACYFAKKRILAFAVLGLSCKDLPRCPQRFALPFMPSGTLTDPT